MADTEQLETNPAKAPALAWAHYGSRQVQCPVCAERHTYAGYLRTHGMGSPPVKFGRLVRKKLQADPGYQELVAEQIQEAKRKGSANFHRVKAQKARSGRARHMREVA